MARMKSWGFVMDSYRKHCEMYPLIAERVQDIEDEINHHETIAQQTWGIFGEVDPSSNRDYFDEHIYPRKRLFHKINTQLFCKHHRTAEQGSEERGDCVVCLDCGAFNAGWGWESDLVLDDVKSKVIHAPIIANIPVQSA